MVKTVSPEQLPDNQPTHIPKEVISIFNELITENWDGRKAHIKQNSAVNRIVNRLEVCRKTIFQKHWLDVEEIFRQAGWVVMFDKPGYCEPYEAYFEFSKKDNSNSILDQRLLDYSLKHVVD